MNLIQVVDTLESQIEGQENQETEIKSVIRCWRHESRETDTMGKKIAKY